MESRTQPIQNNCAETLALSVVQDMQCWICDFAFLLKLIAAPPFAFKNLLQCEDNHNVSATVQRTMYMVNEYLLLKALFTY